MHKLRLILWMLLGVVSLNAQLRLPVEVYIRPSTSNFDILQTEGGISKWRSIGEVLGTGGITQMFEYETITGGVRLKLGNLGGEVDFLEGSGITISRVDNKFTFAAAVSSVDWSAITGKPSTFAPSAHTHTEANITDLDHYTDADIDGNESAFNNWDKNGADDFDGAYSSLTGKPTIPTNNNQLTNGAGYFNTLNDGAGNGLDADLLDGQQGSYYLNYNNLSNKPTIPSPDGNGIYSANGSVNGRFVGVGSSGLTFSGNGSSNYPFNFSSIRVRGTAVNEGFFSTQTTVSTPTNSSTGLDYVGYRGSTSALLNDGTTIVGGESAFYLKPPNQYAGTATTGMVMTLQSSGQAAWQAAPSGGSVAWSSITGIPAGFADNTDNDTNTQLSQENVQDFVGTMFSGNTESGIAVTYDDAGNEVDFTVSVGSANVVDNSLTASDLAANSVGASELASSGITAGTYGSTTQVPRITFDADGRATGVSLQTISSGSDGNGIYSGNGSVNGRTVSVGSNSLYFQGVSATNAEIRGYTLSEAFFNNQTTIGTPTGSTTGWDGVGYRASTSYLMNNGTTIVRGEGSLFLAPPNQSTASTGWVMTKQADGSASWAAASGGSDGNGIYSANGTVNGRTITVGSSDLLFDMTSTTSNVNFDGGRLWGTSVGEMVFSNQTGISTPTGSTTGWDYVGYRGSTSALMNDGTTIVRGEGSLFIAPPNQASASEGEVLTKQSDGSTDWDLGGKFSKAEYITGAGSTDNTFTSTSPVYIQTAADNLILDDNRAGRVFVIQVHSGSAQINTTSGTVIVDGVGYANGGYFQPAGTTHTYVRNEFNTHWIALKH